MKASLARTAAAALGAALMGATALAADAPMDHEHMMHDMLMVSRVSYTVPDIRLRRQSGEAVSLREEMDDGRPVVLNFIYTSCATTCPMLTQTLSMFEDKLGTDRQKVHLMSISIDPEQDTPERLTEYAKRFHAGPEWQYYTGTLSASLAAQHAFDVYRGDKMSHTAVTLLRASPGQPWQRIEGLVTADELLQRFRELTTVPLAAK